MANKNIIGIDPGLSGAIALLDHNGKLLDVVDMPTRRLGVAGKKRQVDEGELTKLLTEFNNIPRGCFAVLEQVNGNPIGGNKKGSVGAFNFGMGYGVIKGVLGAVGIEYTTTPPKAWKYKARLIGRDKKASIARALEYYPDAPLTLVKHDGRAEAILIARFGG